MICHKLLFIHHDDLNNLTDGGVPGFRLFMIDLVFTHFQVQTCLAIQKNKKNV